MPFQADTSKMPQLLTIEDFKAKRKAKLAILQAFVHKKLDDVTFLIGDGTGQARMSVANNLAFGKDIEKGLYVKLLAPAFDVTKGEFSLQRAPMQSAPIPYLPLEDDGPAEQLGSFEGIGDLPNPSTMPSVVSKVIFLSPTKSTRGGSGSCRTAALKDHMGNRVAVNLFGDNVTKVEMDGVYTFRNLQVSKYKGEARLATGKKSEITEVDKELANQFAPLGDEDGVLQGTIMGFEKPYLYDSCPTCGKSANGKDDHKLCPHLTSVDFVNIKLRRDFNVTLQIVDANHDIHEVGNVSYPLFFYTTDHTYFRFSSFGAL